MTTEQALVDAAETGATVTVISSVTGENFTGTIGHHGTLPGFYVLRTGGRGRPRVLHPMDVEDVIFE